MGLDMYLQRRTYIRQWNETTNKPEIVGHLEIEGIDPTKAIYVIEEVGVWRKANAIHRWFVEHVQQGQDDCRAYSVEIEHLQALLALVETVLEHPELAAQLLPTQTGFFFGSTAYDQMYFDDLRETVTILGWALNGSPDAEFTYQSSW